MYLTLILANLVVAGVYLYVCTKVPARALYVLLLVLGLGVVYVVHIALTVGYGELRFLLAQSDAERAGVVGGDGAKVIASILLFGPVVSLVTGGLGGAIFIVRLVTDLRSRSAPSIGAVGRSSHCSSTNPYDPSRVN